jgi:ABC-type nitrate/sulfonate/bicarbonate transport system permease component
LEEERVMKTLAVTGIAESAVIVAALVIIAIEAILLPVVVALLDKRFRKWRWRLGAPTRSPG